MLTQILALGGVIAAPFAPTPSQGLPEYVPMQLAMRSGLTHKCLDAPADGSRHAQQSACLPVGDLQTWSFWPRPDGTYVVLNMGTGGCLTVESQAADTRVVDAPCDMASNQRWWVHSKKWGNGYPAIIWSAMSGHCLTFSTLGAFQAACRWESGNAPSWTLLEPNSRVERADSTLFQLSVRRGGLCAREVGSWVDLGACGPHAYKANRVATVPLANPKYFQLRLASGRCLSGASTSGYLWASGAVCNTGDALQRWELLRSGAELQVRNQGSGQCLNAKDGAATAGTWLIHWPCAPGSDNARWSFTAEPR